MGFNVKESHHGRVMVLSLSGIFNLEGAASQRVQRLAETVVIINQRVKNKDEGIDPYGLIIELKDLLRMDTAGLGVLEGVLKNMSEAEGMVRLCSASVAVRSYLRANKSSLLPFFDKKFHDSLRNHFQGYF